MSKNEINLPAYTIAENLVKLADVLRQKNNIEDDAKPLFGLGDGAYRNCKSALKTFGLINDNASFTETGREFAFGDTYEKRKIFKKVISTFLPYESLINTCLNGKQQQVETPIDFITNFWGKFNYGSTERNRKEAASLFSSILEYIEFGNFARGRGETPSRFIWKENAKAEFNNILNSSIESTPSIESVNQQVEKVLKSEEETVLSDPIQSIEVNNKTKMDSSTQVTNKPTIIVKVDMTSWDDEKICNFFKYANGCFE